MSNLSKRDVPVIVGCMMMAILIQCIVCSIASALLNENCTVSVLNRTVSVDSEGNWRLNNIPSNMGPVRVRVTCTEDGKTVSGQSEYVTIQTNGDIPVEEIFFNNDYEQVPTTLTINSEKSVLGTVGETTRLTVWATYPDGSFADVTSSGQGTVYTVSNSSIGTVSSSGVVTAITSGNLIVSVSSEMVLSSISISILLSIDSDGDGLPDDFELANGLNPNNPIDAQEDMDTDGLTNLEEFNIGTGVNNADTDGDGIEDGEEVVAGEDGFITNPLFGDSDGDGIWDGLEISSGTDPNDANSFDLAATLNFIEVAPSNFVIVFNTIMGEATRQLTVTGTLTDGRAIDLTSTGIGTNYTSSDLAVASFGLTNGLVYAGTDGTATITVDNSGFSVDAIVTVETFVPTSLSFVDIPGFANNVDVSGDYAYVAAGSAGLQVVDVSDRNIPAVVASIDTTGNANDVKVVDNTAFIADGSSGLQIIDITNPLTPSFLGAVNTPGDAQDVVVAGNLAYVADGSKGLQVIDISILTSPIIIGSVDTPGNAYGVDVDLLRSLAVVADRGHGIKVIDITFPENPSIEGSVDTGDALDVVLRNNFALVADYSSSFTSVDISNPANPLVQASTPRATGGLLNDVVLSGQFAFGSDIFFVNGVPIIDVSTPGTPIPQNILNFGGIRDDNGTGIAVDSSYVYLTAAKGSSARLYIGQYMEITDTAGIPPTVNITAPVDGDTVIEGIALPITVSAVDDIAVAMVDFSIDDVVVFTDTSVPYQFDYTVPVSINSFTISATARDMASNSGTSGDMIVNVVPDPLTRVVGRVVDVNGVPVAMATIITNGGVSIITGTDGVFDIVGVPTILGDIVVNATANVSGVEYFGVSSGITPESGGTTTMGDVTMDEVYVNNGLVANYPFNRNANDESGNGNHGTVNGSTLTTDRFGNTDRAYSFDGVDDYIDVWSTAEINNNINTNEGTISTWFYGRAYGGFVYQYFGGTFGSNSDRLYLYLNPQATLHPGTGNSFCDLESVSLETWYHVVHVWNSDGSYKLFVNGELAGECQFGNPGFVFLGNERFYFGRGWSGNPDYLDGIIDDIRIYNRALTEPEIEALFNNIIPDPLTTLNGIVVDDNGSHLGGATVSTVNGLSTATLSDGSFSIPNVPTIFGDIQATVSTYINGIAYSGISTPVPPVQGGVTDVGNVSVVEAYLNDGLVAHYPFNGNADDESWNGNHGTVNGAILTTDRFGNIDNAYSFDGVDDQIHVQDDTSLQFGTNDFSISFWLNTISSGFSFPIDKDHNNASSGLYRFMVNKDVSGIGEDQSVSFSIQDSGTNILIISSTTQVTDGNWHHVVGIRDKASGVLRIYVDGIEDAIPVPDDFGSTDNTKPLAFSGGSTSAEWIYDGSLDDIRVYNRVLNSNEVKDLFKLQDPLTTVIGSVVDVDGNAVDGATVIANDGSSTTTGVDGSFTIEDVSTISEFIHCTADFADINGTTFAGTSASVPPIRAGVTDVEIIQIAYNVTDDFEEGTNNAWSNTSSSSNSVFSTFLGRFGNQAVTLTLSDIPPHSEITVHFDLYLLDSWDGNATTIGPDYFKFREAGSSYLINDTFIAVNLSNQTYDAVADPPEVFGANIGYGSYNDTIYRDLSGGFTFAHTGTTFTLEWSASGLQDLDDESWGIDNVVITLTK